jgi:MSHA biogenesis protein MshM
MYLDHFGLDEPPFRITPHTDFFFDGADRGTTLEGLLYAIQYEEGIVKVSGEVGSGKTMLCRVLMERLPENVETIYLANPSFTRDEILLAIADDLKLEANGESARVLMRELQEHLIASHASGRRVVILIDEAHAMPEDSLEQVRLLSNLETSRHKLLQIVLFGQPELDQMLAASSLRQLRDRITHSFRMRPLTEEEVSRYVTFRLRAAGYRGPDLFTRKAIALLTRASEGLTRRINILADKALLSAFAADTHAVDEKHVQRAVADAELPPIAKTKRPLAYIAVALAIGAVIGVFVQWVFTNQAFESAPPPQAMTAEQVPKSKPPIGPMAPPAQPAQAATPPSEPPERRIVAPKQRDLAPTPQDISPTPKETTTTRSSGSTGSPATKAQASAQTSSTERPIPPKRTAVSEVPAPSPKEERPVAPSVPVASAPVMQKAVAAAAIPARILPKQIERIEAYSTGGMPLLAERIAATREVLQSAPDDAFSIELYRTLNTDPARIERFLIRARSLETLSGIYVIPLTGRGRTRVWVLYGFFPTRAEAEQAAQRLPQPYRGDFQLRVRNFAELRKTI